MRADNLSAMDRMYVPYLSIVEVIHCIIMYRSVCIYHGHLSDVLLYQDWSFFLTQIPLKLLSAAQYGWDSNSRDRALHTNSLPHLPNVLQVVRKRWWCVATQNRASLYNNSKSSQYNTRGCIFGCKVDAKIGFVSIFKSNAASDDPS